MTLMATADEDVEEVEKDPQREARLALLWKMVTAPLEDIATTPWWLQPKE